MESFPPSDRVRAVIYEGEVNKRGNYVRNWRVRYFVLWRDGPALQYWKRSAEGAWKLKGTIDVASIASCTWAGASVRSRTCCRVAHARVYMCVLLPAGVDTGAASSTGAGAGFTEPFR